MLRRQHLIEVQVVAVAHVTGEIQLGVSHVDRGLAMEALLLPLAHLEHVAQMLDRVPDVDKTRVQRRQAEAQHVGRAEVADHAACDQCLDDGVGAFAADHRHLGAAMLRVVRRDQLEAVTGASFDNQAHEGFRQRQRLAAQRVDAAQRLGGEHGVDAAFQRGHRDHRRRAAKVACDAGCRCVVRREGKRRGVAHPAGQRLPEAIRMARMHPDEGGRARAAVQVLVAATDGEVGVLALQVHRHGAGAVGEVPHRERAGVMRRLRQRGHVVHGGRCGS